MASFGAWIKASSEVDSKGLRDFAGGRADWPADGDDFGKYAEFIVQNETDQAKRDDLLSSLAREFSSWRAPPQSWASVLLSNIGSLFLVVFGIIVAIILVWGIFWHGSSFIGLIAKADQARGLITFMVSFTTIALFILIGITTFWMNKDDVEARFNKAKDLLTIMIGIFGTILGFYYGSLANTPGAPAPSGLSLTNFGVPSVSVAPGGKTTIGAAVLGGKAPLKYDVLFADPTGSAEATGLNVKDLDVNDNKVAQPITIPATLKAPSLLNYVLVVHDAAGDQAQASGTLMVQSKSVQP